MVCAHCGSACTQSTTKRAKVKVEPVALFVHRSIKLFNQNWGLTKFQTQSKIRTIFGNKTEFIVTETHSPRTRRHQRTQQAILDAARAIIRSEGVVGLSMRAIAERIDYSPAGLYEYFDGKDEIIAAVCDAAFDQLTQALRATDPSLPPRAFLRECGVNYVRFALENTDAFLLMFTNAPLAAPPDSPTEAMLRHSPAFMVLYDAVQRCVEAGVFTPQPDYDTLAMAMTCWQMVHGMAMLAVTILRTQPPDLDALRRSLEVLLAGIAAR